MEELFSDESIKQFSKLLFETIKSAGSKLFSRVKKYETDLQNQLHAVSKSYLERFEKRYGYLQILGMNEPMSLSNVFVDVNFLDFASNQKYDSIEQLKKAFLEDKHEIRTLQTNDSYKIDAVAAAEDEPRLLVVGGPGSGKSTFLKKVAIESLRGANKLLGKYIPIMIELKNIDAHNSIEKLILSELEISNFPDAKLFFDRCRSEGRLLILLDGLDEVPAEFEDKTIMDIKNFCDRNNSNRFIVSCRVASYKGGLTNFKNVEVANLDKRQIKSFIEKWFLEKNRSHIQNLGARCCEDIFSAEYKATLELAQTPLLLTLLCLVYYYQQDFPRNRSILYRDAINVLLKEWNAEKRIHSETVYKDMTLPFEELLLANIAHAYFIKNEYFFYKHELSTCISNFIGNNLNSPKFLDGQQILDAISVQQGILVERAKNIYSFSHLTFQEYFTAKYIDDNNLSTEYINAYLLDPKWREIFILLCGIMKAGADKILHEINDKALHDLTSDPTYMLIVKKIDNIDPDADLKLRLLLFLFMLLYTTNYFKISDFGKQNFLQLLKEIDISSHSKAVDSWILDCRPHVEMHYTLYTEFIANYVSSSRLFYLLNLAFVKQRGNSLKHISNDFCNAIDFPFIELSSASTAAIDTYINNITYLYHCKKTAILVSRDKWLLIEKSIFFR